MTTVTEPTAAQIETWAAAANSPLVKRDLLAKASALKATPQPDQERRIGWCTCGPCVRGEPCERVQSVTMARRNQDADSDQAAAFIALYAAGETLLEFWRHGTPVNPGSDAASDFLAAMVRAKYLTHA